MSNKRYGLDYERKRKKQLESKGCVVMRCRGSFGNFDIVGHDGKKWFLESVKATRDVKKSFSAELKRIREIWVPDGTVKRLVFYRRGMQEVVEIQNGHV